MPLLSSATDTWHLSNSAVYTNDVDSSVVLVTPAGSGVFRQSRHLLAIRAYAVSQAPSISASSNVSPRSTFFDLRSSSSSILSENKFILIVRRHRSRLTSLPFGRLYKYAFHLPRAGASLLKRERLDGNQGRFCGTGCLPYSRTW
jgi:hypothetical protein